ncbi:MAG: hypothetical protein WD773_00715 [Gemmatimonadales bacterium]
MRKLIGGMVFAAIALSIPATAMAQRRAAAGGARHEFGIDLGAAYVKPDGFDGGIVIGTPVDVRVGLVSTGNMMWEPRFTLDFNTVGGNTTYLFTPGVNVLFANSPGRHRNGMYFTGGAGLLLGDDGANSGTAFSLNAGVGWRKPYGSAAWRYELGFQWTSESTDLGLPSTIAIGGRIGVSFWH